jgi:hypothetical protein
MHATGVRLFEPDENPAQRRLASPVGADQPDAGAALDAPVDVAEELLTAVTLGHVLQRNEHAPSLGPGGASRQRPERASLSWSITLNA